MARESYLQWLRDNERRAAVAGNSKSATVTSADLAARSEPVSSPSRTKALKAEESETKAARSSPKPSCSHSSTCSSSNEQQFTVRSADRYSPETDNFGPLQSSPKAGCSSQRDSPKPCSSSQPPTKSSTEQLSGMNFLNVLKCTLYFFKQL